MKKHFSLRSLTLSLIALTLLVVIVIITTTNSKAAPTLSTKLSGRILLQVEDHGKAWYVSPDNNNQRIYLGSPQKAFYLMKTLGLGISNNDLNKYLDNKFPVRLAGKILLAVEQHGEAYYINPLDLKAHYLGRPIDAFNIMRQLALGITTANLNTIGVLSDSKMLEKYNIPIDPENNNDDQTNSETTTTSHNISLVTQEVIPMTNFSQIVSVSATIDNPDNITIKEKGLLYDFTTSPNISLTPTIEKHNQKIVSELSSLNNTYTLDINNLSPGSYPFIRAYLITEDKQIVYGNTITIKSINKDSLPSISSSPSASVVVYNLTYQAGDHGSIEGDLSQKITKGKNGTLVTAIPSTGYHFVEWSDNQSTSTTRTDVNVVSDISATANFAINTYTLTYTAGENGTIMGSDGVTSSTITQTLDYGSNGDEITAVPAENCHFLKWSDGSLQNPRTNKWIFGNLEVEAEFGYGLIKNGGFELIDKNFNEDEFHWYPNGMLLDLSSDDRFLPVKSSEAHGEGSVAIEFKGMSEVGISMIMSDSFELATDTSYTLKFHAKAKEAGQKIGVVFGNFSDLNFWKFNNNELVGGEWTDVDPSEFPTLFASSYVKYIDLNSAYTEFEVPAIIGDGREVQILLMSFDDGILLDDLSFKVNDEDDNLLINPSFEDGWNYAPLHWNLWKGEGNNAIVEIASSSDCHSGDYCMKVGFINEPFGGMLSQNVDKLNNQFDLSFYIKKENPGAANSMIVFITRDDNWFYNVSTGLWENPGTFNGSVHAWTISLDNEFELKEIKNINLEGDFSFGINFCPNWSENSLFLLDDVILLPSLLP